MKEGAYLGPVSPNDDITPGKGISQKAGQRIDSVHGQTGTTEAKATGNGDLYAVLLSQCCGVQLNKTFGLAVQRGLSQSLYHVGGLFPQGHMFRQGPRSIHPP